MMQINTNYMQNVSSLPSDFVTDDGATANDVALSVSALTGELVPETVGTSISESAGTQDGIIDVTTIDNANEDGGGLNWDLATFAGAANTDSVINIVDVDATDPTAAPVIYIGSNTGETVNAMAEATNVYSAAGATVGMNNTVGDGATLAVDNCDDNAITPAGLTNSLDIVGSNSVPTNIESSNWSGAVITAASGESFSTVSATWVVPTVSQVPITGVTISDVAEWVGIDGYNSGDVCQAGVLETVQTSGGHTTISISAWVEWYPADAVLISASSFQVNPGNTIKVTVETTGAGATTATFILDDETTGQIYDTNLTAPAGTKLEGNSAEFIVETPELISGNQVSQPLLSDFLNSPVVFENDSATYATGSSVSLSSAQSIGMWTDNVPGSQGSSVQEAYGSIQAASDTVTVTENEYWPAASSPAASLSASSITIAENQAIAASSLFTLTNPSGDSITQYSFEDEGGGSGHFTVNGMVEPDGQAFTVSAGNLSTVEYVGGASAGTDTLTIDAYDVTAGIWVPAVSLSAVTTAPATTVTAVVESPSSGIVNAGETVTITIDLSATVTVAGGTPSLELNDGGTARYSGGSGTDALIFQYTVLAGQNTNDLLISSINLNGATVTDGAGNNADFSNLTSIIPTGTLQVYTTPTASVSAHTFTVLIDQPIAASSFFSIANPNGDSITQYSFEDTGGGSGYFTLAGAIEPDGRAFTVNASNLSSVEYVGGSSVGTDTLIVDAYDATAAAWVSSISVGAVTTTPATVSAHTFAVSPDEAVAASSFFSIVNPTDDSITQYSFEDKGGGNGYFTLAGTIEPDGQAFIVSASDLSSVQYVGGSTGTDTLIIDAYDATVAAWVPAVSVSAITTNPASVSASSFAVAPHQAIAASSFFSITNPAGDSVTQYSFEDTGGGSGYFTLAGTIEPDGQAFTVNASNLSSVEYVGGSSVGTDELIVDAYDATVAAWVPSVSISAITIIPASVSASSFTVSLHEAVAASSFFSIVNPNGDNITQYSFEDTGGGSGYFTLAGTIEPDGQAFTVNASNLSSVQYVGGGAAGTDTLIVDAYDATVAEWIPSVSVSAITTTLPSVSASGFTVAPHQAVAASSFFSIVNPNGDNITQYSFEDTGGGSGYFTLAGTIEPDGQPFTVNASNLSSVQYVGGGAAGTDTLIVDAYDATVAEWAPPASLSAVTTAAFPLANNYDLTEAVYIGYFGRAADPGGDAYWLDELNDGAISEVGMAASFSVQAAATAMYSFLANPSAATVAQIDSFITAVYEDLFDSAPDPGGLAYWQNQLEANLGNPIAVGVFILQVISGAQGSGQTTISNKVTVADYFTQQLNSAGISFTASADSLAHTAIASVTSNPSTVLAAESTINSWLTAQSSAAEVALVGVSHTSTTAEHI